MNKIKIEYQYFEECPNHKILWDNLEAAIYGLEDKIELVKVLVENVETARRISFRGSPTLLIEEEDLEKLPAQESASLSCRFYLKGVPTSEIIRKKILLKIKSIDNKPKEDPINP